MALLGKTRCVCCAAVDNARRDEQWTMNESTMAKKQNEFLFSIHPNDQKTPLTAMNFFPVWTRMFILWYVPHILYLYIGTQKA